MPPPSYFLHPQRADDVPFSKESRRGQYSSIHAAFSLLQPQLVMPAETADRILKAAQDDAKSSLDFVNPRVRGGVQALYDLQSKWYADARHGQFE